MRPRAAGYVERQMPHNVDGNALSFDAVTTGEKDDGAKAGPFRDATCVICEARLRPAAGSTCA